MRMDSLRRAVRIIQDEPEAGTPDIAAWMDTIELDEGEPPVPELVIALALSKETAVVARELIRKWVVEGVFVARSSLIAGQSQY